MCVELMDMLDNKDRGAGSLTKEWPDWVCRFWQSEDVDNLVAGDLGRPWGDTEEQ